MAVSFTLARIFAVLDADADGFVTLEDLQRPVVWSPKLQRLAPTSDLDAAFQSAGVGPSGLSESEFTSTFFTQLSQRNAKLRGHGGRAAYSEAVFEASVGMVFELFPASDASGGDGVASECSSSSAGHAGGGAAVVDRSLMGPLLDAIAAAAQLDGDVRVGMLKPLDILGRPSRTVTSDAFVAAMLRVVERGVEPATVVRTILAHQRTLERAKPSGSKQDDASTGLSPHDHKGRAAAFTRVNSKSPGRLRSQSMAAPPQSGGGGDGGDSSNGGQGIPGGQAAVNVRLEERCRQLQAQVADLQREVDRLRKAADQRHGGGGAGMTKGSSAESRSLQKELAELKDEHAATKGRGAREVAEKEDEIRRLKAIIDQRDEALLIAKGRNATLEKYASSHQSWIDLLDGFRAGLVDIVDDAFASARRIRSEEADQRAAVASAVLSEVKRKTQAFREARAEAEELMSTVKSREEDLSMREAMLVVQQSKFQALQNKAEAVALPERERRLEMLKRIERDAGDQLASIRRAQAELLEREHALTQENVGLREQVTMLNRALIDAETKRAATACAAAAASREISAAAAAGMSSSAAASPQAASSSLFGFGRQPSLSPPLPSHFRASGVTSSPPPVCDRSDGTHYRSPSHRTYDDAGEAGAPHEGISPGSSSAATSPSRRFYW